MNMRQDNNTVITLRPSVWQFFINELPMLLLCICACAVGGLPNKEIGKTALAIAGLLSLCLLYRFIYLR
ncbi:PH domain-containing protein, partial [Parabacteroides distasonis]